MSFSTSELRARRARGQEKRVLTVAGRAINQLTAVPVLEHCSSASLLARVLEYKYDVASEQAQNVPTAFPA